MMIDELKCCPMCGCPYLKYDDDEPQHYITCKNFDCNFHFSWCEKTGKSFIEAWNTRPESQELAELKAQNNYLLEKQRKKDEMFKMFVSVLNIVKERVNENFINLNTHMRLLGNTVEKALAAAKELDGEL
jgi:hypothetical protein